MNEKLVCRVVVWPRRILEVGKTAVEVTVKEFDEACPTCGHDSVGFGERKAAAYQDGRDFGEMLAEVGSSEYRRGLLDALRDAGYLQSAGV